MKNDMRVTLPLWQMIAIAFLIVFTIFISAEFTLLNKAGVIFVSFLVVFVLYFTLFIMNIFKHNRRYPNRKIRTFTVKPQEYIEDDELFEQITKRATQKVYTYYTWTLPLLVGLALGGEWSATVILVGILLLSMGQYWIYYRTMKNFLLEEEE